MAAGSDPSQSQNAQEFMFVDLSRTSTSPNHSRVLSHVRQNYHRRQRREKIDRLRDLNVAIGPADAERLPLPSRIKPSISDPASDSEDDPKAVGIEKGAILVRRRKTLRDQTSLPSQSIVKHGGNSDPFNAFAIKIDPQINEVISFYRDYVLPAQYHSPSTAWVSSPSARLDWSVVVSTLHHTDLASAFIARAATIAAVLSPSLRDLATRQRLRSIQQMRVRMLNSELHGWTDLSILQVIMLQKIEIVEKNLAGAAAHAKILEFLFQERQRIYGTVDFTLLQYALWSDGQISTVFMSPLSFDIDPGGWVARTMQPRWKAALEELESIPQWRILRQEAENGLDRGIEGVEMRSFFISRRTTLATWIYFGLKGLPVPPHMLLWLTTTATVQQGRMIKHFLHAVHVSDEDFQGQEQGREHVPLQEYWYIQRYLILAEFIFTHNTSYKVVICGVDLFDIRPTLMRDLQTALSWSSRSSRYQNARLWALFLGSHAEHQASKSPQPLILMSSSEQDDMYNSSRYSSEDIQHDAFWFRSNLALHLRRMCLSTWTDVSAILHAFNYADVSQPLGEDLLKEVLAL